MAAQPDDEHPADGEADQLSGLVGDQHDPLPPLVQALAQDGRHEGALRRPERRLGELGQHQEPCQQRQGRTGQGHESDEDGAHQIAADHDRAPGETVGETGEEHPGQQRGQTRQGVGRRGPAGRLGAFEHQQRQRHPRQLVTQHRLCKSRPQRTKFAQADEAVTFAILRLRTLLTGYPLRHARTLPASEFGPSTPAAK